MRHKLEPILLLICFFQLGCETLDSPTLWPRYSGNSSIEQPLERQFNLNDPAERQEALARIDRDGMRLDIANARIGSKVGVSDEFGHQFHGTLFQKGPSSVELMNCIGKEAVPGPDGQNQCKTTHVPFQSFKISNLLHFAAYEQPPTKLALRGIRYDRRDVTVDALVFMSGRRLSWDEPPAPDKSDRGNDSAENVYNAIATTDRGSQVCFVDASDQRFNGVLLSASPERVEVMNCVWREAVPGPDGQMQCKTNHVPFRSFESSIIRSYEIVAPPAPELDVSELGEIGHELCIDKFAYSSDLR